MTHGARGGHPLLGLALGLGLGLLVVGCGAPSRLPLSARQPGTTTILVANHLGQGDEIDHLRVSIDEALLPLSTVPPRSEIAAALGSLRLPPGPHTISVRVTTHGRDGGVAVVDARQIFHVGESASEIDIDLRNRMEPGEQDARIAVDLSMVGGHMNPELGAGPPEGKDARCAPLQPIPRALCRAAADLDAIREQYRRFTDAAIIPNAHAWHLANDLVPDATVQAMAELGTFGVCIPEEYGGLGLTMEEEALALIQFPRRWMTIWKDLRARMWTTLVAGFIRLCGRKSGNMMLPS